MVVGAALREQLRARLAAFERHAAPAGSERAAAVAITVIDEGLGADLPGLPEHTQWQDSAALLLTRRALHLRRHAGQWALPGGRMDAGETPEQAALREMHEEVGLRLPPEAVLGRLDDFVTRSGFCITPVVVWGGAVPALQPDPNEVSRIHRIPVREFLREDALLLEPLPDAEHPSLRLRVGTQWIAAPTAAMIYQFREVCLRGLSTRVAHYEEPVFARR